MTQVAIRLGVVAAALLVLPVIKSNGLAATFGVRSPRRPSISALSRHRSKVLLSATAFPTLIPLLNLQKCNSQLRLIQVQTGTYPQVKVFTVYVL